MCSDKQQEQPEEFHESLRQIPMRWRSSLSSIMTSMASNQGGSDDDQKNGACSNGGQSGSGDGGRGGGGDMDVTSGEGTGGERKVLTEAAWLKICFRSFFVGVHRVPTGSRLFSLKSF